MTMDNRLKPSILFITGNDPLFRSSGEHLRTRSALCMLSEVSYVTVVSPEYTAEVHTSLFCGFEEKIQDDGSVDVSYVSDDSQIICDDVSGIHPFRRFVQSPHYLYRIKALLAEEYYSICWIDDDGFWGQYIDFLKKQGLKVVYNTQNIQSQINYEIKKHQRPKDGMFGRVNDYVTYMFDHIHERVYFSKSDVILYCNEDERVYYEKIVSRDKLTYLPNVTLLSRDDHDDNVGLPEHSIVWAGSMDVAFHEQGLIFFLDYVWPEIAKRYPSLYFVIAGSSSRDKSRLDEYAKDCSRVKLFRNPDSIYPFFEHAQVSVIPLFIGGGSRIKILDSLQMHVPVVSTTIGASGLALSNNHEILIADSANEFIESISRLLDSRDLRHQMADAGFSVVQEKYTIKVNLPIIEDLIKSLQKT